MTVVTGFDVTFLISSSSTHAAAGDTWSSTTMTSLSFTMNDELPTTASAPVPTAWYTPSFTLLKRNASPVCAVPAGRLACAATATNASTPIVRARSSRFIDSFRLCEEVQTDRVRDEQERNRHRHRRQHDDYAASQSSHEPATVYTDCIDVVSAFPPSRNATAGVQP